MENKLPTHLNKLPPMKRIGDWEPSYWIDLYNRGVRTYYENGRTHTINVSILSDSRAFLWSSSTSSNGVPMGHCLGITSCRYALTSKGLEFAEA